jgi:hypothetical protein
MGRAALSNVEASVPLALGRCTTPVQMMRHFAHSLVPGAAELCDKGEDDDAAVAALVGLACVFWFSQK